MISSSRAVSANAECSNSFFFSLSLSLSPHRRDNSVIGRGDLRPVVRDLQQACDPAIRALRHVALGNVGIERMGVRQCQGRRWFVVDDVEGAPVNYVDQSVDSGQRDHQYAAVHAAGSCGGFHRDRAASRLRAGRSELRELDRHEAAAIGTVRQPGWPVLRPGLRRGRHQGGHEGDRRPRVTDQRLPAGQAAHVAVPRQRGIALRQPRGSRQRVAEQVAHRASRSPVPGHLELPGKRQARDLRPGHGLWPDHHEELQAASLARELGHEAGFQNRLRRRETVDLVG